MKLPVDKNLVFYAQSPDACRGTAETEQDQFAPRFSLYDFIMHLNHGSLQNEIQSGVLPKAGGNRGKSSPRGEITEME